MNKFIRVTVLIFFTGLIAYGVYYLRQEPTSKIQVKLVDKNITPKKFERVFRPVQLEKTSLGDSITEHVINPARLTFKNGDLFILDVSEKKVKQFDKNGQLVNTIGNGTGRGPGEMIHANDFLVQGKKIWIIDSSLMRISRFDLNGNFEDSFSVDYHPISITGYGDNLFIKTLAQEYVIKRLDYEGNKLGEFSNLLNEQIQDPLAVTGRIASYKSSVIFVPTIASLVYFYRADTLHRVARRADGLSFKSSIDKSDEDRKMYMAPEAKFHAYVVRVVDDNLYILMFERADEVKQGQPTVKRRFVDVYDAESGKYRYSFKIPVTVGSGMALNNNLFVTSDGNNRVISYQISGLQ